VRYQVCDDRDEHLVEDVFWVSPEARWRRLQDSAKQPDIGERIDAVVVAIE
jgi:type I restriction enzyme M protein